MTDSFFKNDSDDKPQAELPKLPGQSDETIDGLERTTTMTDEGRMAAILAYIPILCFIPLLSMKENADARFHARQGVLLFLLELVAVIFLIDGISNFVFKAILIVGVVMSIAGIYFAFQGKNFKLPIIGEWADKQKF